jgi:hypothetical protein
MITMMLGCSAADTVRHAAQQNTTASKDFPRAFNDGMGKHF